MSDAPNSEGPRVLVLRNGRIEQQGHPAELVEQEGYFRDMMNSAIAAPTH